MLGADHPYGLLKMLQGDHISDPGAASLTVVIACCDILPHGNQAVSTHPLFRAQFPHTEAKGYVLYLQRQGVL